MTGESSSGRALGLALSATRPGRGRAALGWHPLDVLVFLFVETWLFLTLRMGIEAC